MISTGPAMAVGPAAPSYTCTGGQITDNDPSTATFIPIPSGTYSTLTVKGVCTVQPDAVINVLGSINVGPGAWLDAQTAPSTITVGHNVNAARGAFVGLGCQPDFSDRTGHPCMVEPDGSSNITVHGNITAINAGVFLLNGVTVKGNVTMIGGGNEGIPWSIKNNTICGNLVVAGQTTDWLGVLFNTVGKNVILLNITLNDPGDPTPTMFIVRNTIGRNLICAGLAPYVAGGFGTDVPNTVGGQALGQCANLPILQF